MSIAQVARIRSALAFATHEYFTRLGFVHVHSPILTASDCEGAGEMFRVTTLPPNVAAPPADSAAASGGAGWCRAWVSAARDQHKGRGRAAARGAQHAGRGA